jgi:cytochrome c oxidase subunit II
MWRGLWSAILRRSGVSLVAGVGAVLCLLLPGAAWAEGFPVFDPVSPPAESIRDLFILVGAISAGILLVVGGMLVYCIVRFRARAPAGQREAEPPQLYGSGPIEVAWTVGPVLIVFVLFLVVIRTVFDVRRGDMPDDALHVRVIGHQWWWEFEYPESGVRTANELHVPISDADQARAVVLELESADVVHSFWVPRLAGKTDLIPGRKNTMWFEAQQAGVYHGQCAEYCGTQHANMLIRVVAHPAGEFQAWLDDQRQDAAGETKLDDKERAGRRVFLSKTCVNCHTIRGTPAHGTVGPDLTHLASRETLAAGVLENNRGQLAQWLADPQASDMKPGCNMPDLQLTSSEIADLVTYLESLK